MAVVGTSAPSVAVDVAGTSAVQVARVQAHTLGNSPAAAFLHSHVDPDPNSVDWADRASDGSSTIGHMPSYQAELVDGRYRHFGGGDLVDLDLSVSLGSRLGKLLCPLRIGD